MNTQRRRNLFKFLVRLKMVAEFKPALGSLKVVRVWRC